jgi:hypothetical protein
MEKKKTEKQEKDKKPNETLNGSVAAHLVIRDRATKKAIVNTRG